MLTNFSLKCEACAIFETVRPISLLFSIVIKRGWSDFGNVASNPIDIEVSTIDISYSHFIFGHIITQIHTNSIT